MKNIFKTTPNNSKTISLFLIFFLLTLVVSVSAMLPCKNSFIIVPLLPNQNL